MLRNALAWLSVVLLLWLLASLTTRLLLVDQSLTERQHWTNGQTPWTWAFARSTDVIEPAFSGITNFTHHTNDQHAIHFVMAEQNADVSLNLRGRKLDPRVGDAFAITLKTSKPTRLWLLSATDETQPASDLTSTVETSGDGLMHTVQLPITKTALAGVLRLHWTGDVGTTITVDHVALIPKQGVAPGHALVPEMVLPHTLRPETLLQRRDQWRSDKPAAILSQPRLEPLAKLWGHATLQTALPVGLIALALLLFIRLAWYVLKPAAQPSQQTSRTKNTVVCSAMLFIASLLLFTEPTSRGFIGHIVLLVTAVVMLLGSLAAPRAKWLGNKQAWWGALKTTAMPLILLILIGLWNGWNHDVLGTRAFEPGRLFRYPIWSTVQQIILVSGFILWAKNKPWSAHHKALIVGTLFALMHSPNFTLMLLTLAIGYAWAKHAQKHEAVLPLAVSHAILGTAVVLCLPTAVLRSAEVGARFLL